MGAFYRRCIAATAAAITVCAVPPLMAAPPSVGPRIAGQIVVLRNVFDHVPAGYVAEEHFLTGTAKSWRPANAGPQAKVEQAGEAPFTTRLVIIRPRDPKKFNGTVLVEWLNVSVGADGAPEWTYLHRELARSGYAYVAVSAQKVGIDGEGMAMMHMPALKQVDPARYAALSHPGDAYAYDIFSQAGAAVRNEAGALLGPLRPKRVLAAGESQSAGLLVTYVNAIDPVARVFDGFLIHSRFRWGRGVDASRHPASPDSSEPAGTGDHIRSEVRVPVLTFITETDLMTPGNFLAARQPDAPRIRTWEVPGAAHADSYTLLGDGDDGTLAAPALAKAFGPLTEVVGTHFAKPVNSAPQHHYVVEAALSALDRWVATGRPPASTMPIAVAGETPAHLVLDPQGNATAGIRSPWLDVPTARLSGLPPGGEGIGALLGSTEPFDRQTLRRLYPGGRADYLARFAGALDRAIAEGHILAADCAEILAVAGAMYGD